MVADLTSKTTLCSMWKFGRSSAALLGGALRSGRSACCVAVTHGGVAMSSWLREAESAVVAELERMKKKFAEFIWLNLTGAAL